LCYKALVNEIGAQEESSVFRALADPTRRQILEDLRPGELTSGEIAQRFAISGPSISRHLGVLKSAGLVRERREANRIYYALDDDRLAMCIARFVSVVCPEQLVLRGRRRRQDRRRGSG
jgi:DNA-binding transcriptional ArsR family regulator